MRSRSDMSALEGTRHHIWASIVLLMAALLLAACDANTNPDNPGWSDGCRAGQARADSPFNPIEPRDDARYSTDANYRQDWDHGFQVCLSRRLNSSVP